MFDSQADHQETHEMILAATHESGAEEWYCPSCGRRFLMHWPPNYHKVILEPGDELTPHRGGKGGVSLGSSEVSPQLDEALKDDPSLQPYMQWMDQVDFKRFWQ